MISDASPSHTKNPAEVLGRLHFSIYIPATEHRAAVKVNPLQIHVYTDDSGNEMVTPESSTLIDKTQTRHMRLLADSNTRTLREPLSLSQDQLSDFLGCGREYPSSLANALLRLQEEKKSRPKLFRYSDPHTGTCGGAVETHGAA